MPRMIASNSMKVGFELQKLGWAVPFSEGQPSLLAPLGVERSSACVLKAKAYGQAGVRAPGAV